MYHIKSWVAQDTDSTLLLQSGASWNFRNTFLHRKLSVSKSKRKLNTKNHTLEGVGIRKL